MAAAAEAPTAAPARRIGLIECEDAAKWDGYTELLWRRAIEQPGDSWTVYKACQGQLPSPQEAAQLDAIIIGGSHYSVYEPHAWISQLLELLRVLARQGTRMYGCCFGCQALAAALGGSVGPNPDGRFVLTIEQVTPTPQLQQFEQLHGAVAAALAAASSDGSSSCAAVDAAADGLAAMQLLPQQPGEGALPPHARAAAAGASTKAAGAAATGRSDDSCSSCFRLIESHGDQVLALPPGATCLAASPTAPNELWCWGSNVLGSQFHLEFDEPLVIEKIWSALAGSRLGEQQADDSRRCLEAGGQQNAALLQVVRHFLAHGIDAPSASAGGCDGAEQPHAPAPPADDGKGAAGEPSTGGPGAACQQRRQQQQEQEQEQPQQQQQQQQQEQQQEQLAAAPASAMAAASWLPGLPLLWAPSGSSMPHGAPLSGCSSPTAASEASVATATSTASTLPFAAIAQQRKAAAREEELQETSRRLVADAAAAFESRMAAYVGELSTLQQMNEAAAAQYGATAEVAAALGLFAADLAARQACLREALAALPALERQLQLLEASVGLLDKRSKALEERVGGGGRGGGMGSSAYAYLASFSRVGSGGSAGGTSGGSCLGGGPAPKQ